MKNNDVQQFEHIRDEAVRLAEVAWNNAWNNSRSALYSSDVGERSASTDNEA